MDLSDVMRSGGAGKIVVPDVLRDALPGLCVALGYTHGAEVGVYKAEHCARFCAAGLSMLAIDPWRAFDGQGRTQQVQARQDFLYGHAGRVLAPYGDRARILRMTSAEAAAQVPPNSLDFVYLDGDHTFSAIAFDLETWWTRVRPGGLVMGHDYWCTPPSATNVVCQVAPVVDAFVTAYQIPRYWVSGVNPTGPKDDRYSSWWFMRP